MLRVTLMDYRIIHNDRKKLNKILFLTVGHLPTRLILSLSVTDNPVESVI